LDDAHLVRHAMQVGHSIGQPNSPFAVAGELARRAKKLGGSRSEGEALPLRVQLRARLAVVLDELRLVVVHVEVRRRSGQVQVDNSVRFWLEVRLLRRKGVDDAWRLRAGFVRQQRGQGERTEAQLAGLQEMPA